MADIIIHQKENRAIVEALIGLALMTLITLLGEKIYTGEPIPIELFWGLGILLMAYVAMVLLTYMRFYIEKMIFIKEQESMTRLQVMTLDKEIEKLNLIKQIKTLEAEV